MDFIEKARMAMAKQLEQKAASSVPPVCGVCEFCAEYEYEGTIMLMCEHKGGPDSRGMAGFVQETLEPPDWCPKRNGIWNTMVQVVGVPGK